MFKKILIANRGEIACRVIKTAQKMGIKTVAVYSDADRNALHVDMADEAVRIGPPPAAQSYLIADEIVRACQATGAEAVHPGYGFLSENAAFCDALQKAGIVFIGPDVHAIDSMGDKMRSKRLAKKAGVNTIPGHDGIVESAQQAVEIAKQIGYPVMLKASAGGGGKGMRVARNDKECLDGFERAKNEAASSFKDDRILIEKFIEQPRHIEIQIMADSHGNVLYLNERECSIQRRNQKVIEEAPSPFLDAKTRKAMGEQAVMLAKAVSYRSAGTVEFVVDAKQNFYFLEMNTRLQVEHPVTEMITGLDLVELMIRVAAGEKLPLTQSEVKLDGWAMEARIYAEDPLRGFLPSIGRLSSYLPPEEKPVGEGKVRVDTGVTEGGEISVYYDPMIAKLITHGSNRLDAVKAMRSALDAFYIRGIRHNIAFLNAIMMKQRFLDGKLTTQFIAEEFPDGFKPQDVPHVDPARQIVVAATIYDAYSSRARSISGQFSGSRYSGSGQFVVIMDGVPHAVEISRMAGSTNVRYADKDYAVATDWQFGQPLFACTINSEPLVFQFERHGLWYHLVHHGATSKLLVLSPFAAGLHQFMPEKSSASVGKFHLSPMPGLVVKLSVEAGQEVKEGEELAVIEAMKMENIITAEQDCKIAKVLVGLRESVAVDQPIIEFE
jgi:propionyl-CoA carboxylase alpha chain